MSQENHQADKYTVSFKGEAQGIVVGDRAQVTQHFHFSGRYAPLRDKFLPALDMLVRGAPDRFIGRRSLLEELDQFVRDHERGYFQIIGLPGLGKTALAAHLVNTRGYPYHFVRNPDVRDARQARFNLCAQIIEQHHLPYTLLSPEVGDNNDFLLKVLHDASERRSGREPIVVVIDALDEAECSERQGSVPFLLQHLPLGVFIVATQRPSERYLLPPLSADTPLKAIVLDPADPEHRADVRSFAERWVKESAVTERLRSGDISRQSFAKKLLAKSQGNFMYLSYVLAAISNGEMDPRKLEGLPEGLTGYYEQFWAGVESTKREGRYDWKTLYRPVISILSVAQEALSIEQIAGFAGNEVDALDVVEYALPRWRRFLEIVEVGGQERWRIYHDSFRDFLMTRLGPVEDCHSRITHYYESCCGSGLKDLDDYGLYHLPYHYWQAQQPGKLRQLLHSTFLSMKWARMGLASLQQDISLGQLALAGARDYEGLLYLLVLELAIHQSHRISGFPPIDVALRALSGEWVRALDEARALLDPDQRLIAMAGLASIYSLAGRTDVETILAELDEFKGASSGTAIARSAVIVSLADFRRALTWMIGLEPQSGNKSLHIHEDFGNYYSSILTFLRKHDLDLAVEGLLFLHGLLYHGNDDFRGLEYPYQEMPRWFHAEYVRALPVAMARRDWRLLDMLPSALDREDSGPPSAASSFEESLEQLTYADVLHLIDLLIARFGKAQDRPTHRRHLDRLLGACARFLLGLTSQDWAQLLCQQAAPMWQDSVVEQAICTGAVSASDDIEVLLAKLTADDVRLRIAVYLIADSCDDWPSTFHDGIVDTAQDLIVRLEDKTTLHALFPHLLAHASTTGPTDQTMERLWVRMSDQPSSQPYILKEALARGFFDFAFEKLQEQEFTEDLGRSLLSWLKVESTRPTPRQRMKLGDWFATMISTFQARETRVPEVLIDALTYVAPGRALTYILANDMLESSLSTLRCAVVAARMGRLDVLIRMKQELLGFCEEIGRYSIIEIFLSDIEKYQPHFVRETIEDLASARVRDKCWIRIARSYLPCDLPRAWSLMGMVQGVGSYGYLDTDYVADSASFRKDKDYSKAGWLFGYLPKPYFEVQETERILTQFNDIGLRDEVYDAILDHLLRNLVLVNPEEMFRVYQQYSKGTRFVIPRKINGSLDIGYLELCLSHVPEALATELGNRSRPAYLISSVRDFAFWYAVAQNDLELASRMAKAGCDSREAWSESAFRTEVALSLWRELGAHGLINTESLIARLQAISLSEDQVVQELADLLKTQSGLITDSELFALGVELPLLGDGDKSNILDAIKDREFASGSVAERLWSSVPHDAIPGKLLTRLVCTMEREGSQTVVQVLDYLRSHKNLRTMPAELFEMDVLSNADRRILLDRMINDIESQVEASDQTWCGFTDKISVAALATLQEQGMQDLVEQLLSWASLTTNEAKRQDALSGLCQMVARLDPQRALLIADTLEDTYLHHALHRIANEDPASVLDYVLHRARPGKMESGREKLMLHENEGCWYPFLRAARSLPLSIDDLKALSDRVFVVAISDSLDKIIVQRFLAEGDIDAAIAHVQRECIDELPLITETLVSEERWQELDDLLGQVAQDDTRDGILVQLMDFCARYRPQQAMYYFDLLRTPKGEYEALSLFAQVDGLRATYPNGLEGLFENLVRVAYQVEGPGVGQRTRVPKVLDLGMALLEPDQMAQHLIANKHEVALNIESVTRWAVAAFRDTSPAPLTALFESVCTDVEKQMERMATADSWAL
jgi:hypothetical protein